MSLMGSLYIGRSGIQTSQDALNTTANNLANIQTEGYVRQQVLQADQHYNSLGLSATTCNQVGNGVTMGDIRQVRDQFMDAAYRQESGRQAFYEASHAAISEIETLFGELEGVQVSEALADLWDALQEVSKTPNDSTALALFRDAAGEFTERCTDVYSGMKEYQLTLNIKIEESVDRINQLGYTIYSLNKQICTIESAGLENANDLRDLRNNALDELSALANISYKETAEGYVLVDLEGADFVTSTRRYEMGVKYDEETDLATPIWPQLDEAEVFDLETPILSKLNTDIGQLKAYLLARGERPYDYTYMPVEPDATDLESYPLGEEDPAYLADLDTYKQKLEAYNSGISASAIGNTMVQFDQLFHGIVTKINDILCPNKEVELADGSFVTILDEENCSYSAEGEIGIELFTRNGYERYTKQTLSLANGETKECYVFNEEIEGQRSTLYTVGNVSINDRVMQDESLIPMTTETGDADYGRAFELIDAWTESFAKTSPESTAMVDYQTYYVQMVGNIANLGSVYNASSEALTSTTTYLDEQRQQVAGVSSDEELTNMVKFQSAYNASSRYFNVVDEMLEHLIAQLGA